MTEENKMNITEGSIKNLLEWFKGQPFSNVMAFLQWGTIVYATYLATYVLLPSERAAILSAQEKQEDYHTKQLERLIEHHSSEITSIVGSFEKALDRIPVYNPNVGSFNGKD